MMTLTHLAATVVAGFLLARIAGGSREAWALALAFGVLIDVDHLFVVPQYFATELPLHGAAAFAPASFLHYPGWLASLHVPVVGGALALAFAVQWETPAPLVAWTLHQWMDWLVGRGHVAFGGLGEWAILAALAAAAVLLARAHVRATWPGLPAWRWLVDIVAGPHLAPITRRWPRARRGGAPATAGRR